MTGEWASSAAPTSGPPEAGRHEVSCQWGRGGLKEGRGFACGQGALGRGLESGQEGGIG